MEISEIKSQLSIAAVLHYYGLKPDKNNKMCCPFHEDKTPSMQIYYKTQTAYCFSSNCKTHGKSMDVIDFILYKENCTKHEAIKKAQEILNPGSGNQEVSREQFLNNMFQYFRNAISNSKPAREYLEKRNLDNSILEIGYNSGQFHHGERKSEELINNALEMGLLLDKGLVNNRTKEKAYQVFANKCIIFPLKDRENKIVSIYGRSILDKEGGKHFYLKNRKGIYPGYAKPDTKKLILTEAIIDCASLLQIKPIANSYSLMACFGTNGLNEEILQAIKDLPELEEIIFCFDNDKAGKTAVTKYAELLKQELQTASLTARFSTVELPCKDVNETLQLHDERIFIQLLEERTFLFSIENGSGVAGQLQAFDGGTGLKHQFLKNEGSDPYKTTKSIDFTEKEKSISPKISPNLSATEFLQQKDLLKSLNQLIEKAGIIGEEQSRLLLFLITISYLNKSPLHGIVQGSSGSGKTHIISRIADLMPQEDVLRFTRITESSLYNWGEFDLFQKIIIIEDLDGLKEDALYALREFISNQVLRSSVTIKDKKGNNKSSHKIVKGQFSSLSATTKGETYEDNMNRSFIIAINESEEQTRKIIDYQNLKNAGMIDRNNEQKAIGFIQKLVKNLKCYEVINPYAMELQLPDKVKNKRRLNEMVQSIIKQITILNQYQRKQTSDGKLITEIEDLEQGIEILFESIILKIDELDGSLRQFLEKLKKRFEQREFNRFEAMEYTGFKKSQLQVYLNELVRLEYLKQKGFVNKGFTYKIGYSDDIGKVRQELKDHFRRIIEKLKLDANGS